MTCKNNGFFCNNKTISYDENDNSIDAGYQNLKIIDISKFTFISKLFIDYNCLTTLPEKMQHLEYLTCSHNKISEVPFYPQLKYLNVSNNKISSLSNYDDTTIEFIDCSYNPTINIDTLYLPQCTRFHISNCNIKHLNFSYYPQLESLDISNNNFSKLDECAHLKELFVAFNKLDELPYFPNLKFLNADNNNISILETYLNLEEISIKNNILKIIKSQPQLNKLIASNNKIENIGTIDKIIFVDISHNNLTSFIIPNKCTHAFIQLNPIKQVKIPNVNQLEIIQISFSTYQYIYKQYYKEFVYSKNLIISKIIKKTLHNYDETIPENIISYIVNYMNHIDFNKRVNQLNKLSNNVKKYINLKDTLKFLNYVYYKSMVITIYFFQK